METSLLWLSSPILGQEQIPWPMLEWFLWVKNTKWNLMIVNICEYIVNVLECLISCFNVCSGWWHPMPPLLTDHPYQPELLFWTSWQLLSHWDPQNHQLQHFAAAHPRKDVRIQKALPAERQRRHRVNWSAASAWRLWRKVGPSGHKLENEPCMILKLPANQPGS